jgi:hypothetical protein
MPRRARRSSVCPAGHGARRHAPPGTALVGTPRRALPAAARALRIGRPLWSNTRVVSLTGPQRAFLLAIAPRIAPASAPLTPAAGDAMLSLIEGTLASRTPAMRRQFGLFLLALRWLPSLRYLRPLDRLDRVRQETALGWFQDHPLQIIRSGFWGVRTLLLLGHYGQPGTGPRIAYTPSTDGNAVLHARARR